MENSFTIGICCFCLFFFYELIRTKQFYFELVFLPFDWLINMYTGERQKQIRIIIQALHLHLCYMYKLTSRFPTFFNLTRYKKTNCSKCEEWVIEFPKMTSHCSHTSFSSSCNSVPIWCETMACIKFCYFFDSRLGQDVLSYCSPSVLLPSAPKVMGCV